MGGAQPGPTSCCSARRSSPHNHQQQQQPPAAAAVGPAGPRRGALATARVAAAPPGAGQQQPLPLSFQQQQQRQQQGGGQGQGDGEDFGYMREYAALKATLLDNTRKAGGVLGGYLLLTAGGGPALCCMVGAAASYLYFSLLCRDVDAVAGTDPVPIWEANKIENPLLRRAAKLAAAYRAALRPRLLVPVGLAAAVGVFNALSPEPLPLLYEGCMAGGFLAYKGALLTKLLQELLPKTYGTSGESRPKVEVIEDELDQWGRPKKAARTPIDALPADAQAKALEQLEKQEGSGGGQA